MLTMYSYHGSEGPTSLPKYSITAHRLTKRTMYCRYCKTSVPKGLWICEACFTGVGKYPAGKLGERSDYLELSIAILCILDQGWSAGPLALQPHFTNDGIVRENNVFVNMKMQTIRDGKEDADLDQYRKQLGCGTEVMIKRLQARAIAESSARDRTGGLVASIEVGSTAAEHPAAMRETDDVSAYVFDHPYHVQEGDEYFNRPRGNHLTTSRDTNDEEDYLAFKRTGHSSLRRS